MTGRSAGRPAEGRLLHPCRPARLAGPPVQWNAAASHRVRTYGASAAVEGDLVLPRAEAAQRAASRSRGQARRQQHAEAGAGAGAEAETASEAAAAGDESAAARAAAGELGDLEADAGSLGEVHVVTAAEAAAGTFSMDDVVLPLPGHAVRLPEHATAGVYRSLAASDGVSLDASPHGAQDFSVAALPGAYRHVIHRPADLEVRRSMARRQEGLRAAAMGSLLPVHSSVFAVATLSALQPLPAGTLPSQCQLLRYSHPDADLALTDLQALQGQQLPPAVGPDDAEGGRLLGLRLAFTLPASCYATMLIRELTKQPTGAEHHKALQQGGAAPAGQGDDQPLAEQRKEEIISEQQKPQASGGHRQQGEQS